MRLIDADELIKRIGEWMPQGPGEIKQTVEERVATDMAASMYMEIEETPTAFDKEKVTQELKSNMESAQLVQSLVGTDLVQCGGFSYGYYNGVKDAVKIVEKGGIE